MVRKSTCFAKRWGIEEKGGGDPNQICQVSHVRMMKIIESNEELTENSIMISLLIQLMVEDL